MSRKLFDSEGNEFEVPTEEELKDLTTKAESVGKLDELQKLEGEVRKSLGIEKEEDLMKAITLAKEAANPNWKKTRDKIAKLEAFAEANGGKVDEETGDVSKEEKQLTKEEQAEETRKTTREEIYKTDLDKKISKYPEKQREVMRKYFDKLSAGEELNAENIDKYTKEAEALVFPKGIPTPTVDGGGNPVIDAPKEGDYSGTQEGKDAGEMLDIPGFKPGDNKDSKDNKSSEKEGDKK